VIYPVIYEDVGEPPYLFPSEQKIKIIPEFEKYPSSSWGWAFKEGVGSIGKTMVGLVKPPKKEE
jgi:hypothetical protein